MCLPTDNRDLLALKGGVDLITTPTIPTIPKQTIEQSITSEFESDKNGPTDSVLIYL